MAPTRRQMLEAGATLVAGAAMPSYVFAAVDLTPTGSIAPAPPEYVPGAPVRTSLLSDGPATEHIRVFGRVLTTKGDPLEGARLDVWQTDAAGRYDEGFRFRARQFTDARGRYRLDTRMPGPYGGVRHIHFLLATRAPGAPQPAFVTGIFSFPTEAEHAEFAAKPGFTHDRDYFPPRSLHTVGAVVMAPCDIVVEV